MTIVKLNAAQAGSPSSSISATVSAPAIARPTSAQNTTAITTGRALGVT
jgi:hypothetical protein